ncbi:CoA-transferase family III domain-containing protein [Aspergillus aurantiobrunneus]
MAYSVQSEPARILHDQLLSTGDIPFPDSFKEAAEKVTFTGDSQPFIPTPPKISDSSAALNALLGVIASAISKDRYGIDHQDITVNTDVASLFLMSIVLATINGAPALDHPRIQHELHKGDLYDTHKPIHRQCTNVYRTKDNRWFHLRGSTNAARTMAMVGVPEQNVTNEEARAIYMDKVAQWDADEIDRVANEEYRQAEVTCYTPDEFFASEQGQIMGKEPLYTLKKRPAPRTPWPTPKDPSRPLAGIRVIDFSRVTAASVISKMLAALGADVLKVTSENLPDVSLTWIDLSTGKRDTNINVKSPEGHENFVHLVESADVLMIDGYRPGVLSRLGVDAESLRQINPSLVYARENCYGWKAPLSYRSGWQQITNSDYQMVVVGAAAVSHALLVRAQEDVTFDIDLSLTQYNIWYYRLGEQTPEVQKELLARNEGLQLRHYDEMMSLIPKTVAAARKTRPDLFQHPEYFETMSGAQWGIDEDISILTTAFNLGKSRLGYDIPSGSRGRSEPKWNDSA